MELYNDNTAMIRSGQHPVEPPSLDHDPHVKRIRRILLISVGINLVSTHAYTHTLLICFLKRLSSVVLILLRHI